MEERLNNSYDIMSFTHGTKSEIEENKDLMLPYEPAIVVDTNEMVFKDEQGNIARVNSKEFEDVWADIEKNKSDILLKMDKDNTTYPYLELIGHDNSFIDFARNSGKDYESRLIQTDNGLGLDNTGVGGTNGLIWHNGDCPISKQSIGWCKFANGMIIQWGYFNPRITETNVYSEIRFPISFAFAPKVISDCVPNAGRAKQAVWAELADSLNYITDVLSQITWVAIGY